jgi:hypothetical protein
MATNYNYFGGIVTNGLVLDLDAAKLASYPGTGTAWYDISGNNNNGTLTNGPTFSGIGKQAAIVFDGVDDYVLTNYTLNKDSGSFFAWINMDVLKNYNQIFDTTTTANEWEFWVYSNGIMAFRTNSSSDGDIRLDSSTSLSALVNYHVGITWDATGGSMYINGALTATDATSSGRIAPPGPISIGASNAGNTRFQGKIYNCVSYNRALSATEVSQNFNALRGRYGI